MSFEKWFMLCVIRLHVPPVGPSMTAFDQVCVIDYWPKFKCVTLWLAGQRARTAHAKSWDAELGFTGLWIIINIDFPVSPVDEGAPFFMKRSQYHIAASGSYHTWPKGLLLSVTLNIRYYRGCGLGSVVSSYRFLFCPWAVWSMICFWQEKKLYKTSNWFCMRRAFGDSFDNASLD